MHEGEGQVFQLLGDVSQALASLSFAKLVQHDRIRFGSLTSFARHKEHKVSPSYPSASRRKLTLYAQMKGSGNSSLS